VLVVVSVRTAYRKEKPAPVAVHVDGLFSTSLNVPPVCVADTTVAGLPPVE
jgi:hypothetical protein